MHAYNLLRDTCGTAAHGKKPRVKKGLRKEVVLSSQSSCFENFQHWGKINPTPWSAKPGSAPRSYIQCANSRALDLGHHPTSRAREMPTIAI